MLHQAVVQQVAGDALAVGVGGEARIEGAGGVLEGDPQGAVGRGRRVTAAGIEQERGQEGEEDPTSTAHGRKSTRSVG